jgi:ATP-dependent DNA helicase RecG
MKPSIEKLQKFFKLEAKRDYDNKAVMGGLSQMLETWEAEARADQLSEGMIQAVVSRLRDYSRISPDSREDVLKGLWNRIRKDVGAGAQESDLPEESERDSKGQVKETHAQKSEKSTQKPAKADRKPKKARPRPEGPPAAMDAAVTVLDGVGPANAKKLGNLGLNTLSDMLYHFPRRYDDYSELKTINRLKYGEEVTIIGTVQSVTSRKLRGGNRSMIEVIISDGSGALRINWFNQPWLLKSLSEGTQVVLSGKIDQYLGRLGMNSPEWELLDEKNLHTNRIVPVYPLTAKLTQRWLRGQMDKVVNYWALRVQDPLPESLRESAQLLDLPEALLQNHFPDSWEDLKDAQHRLAFDEIFYLQIGVLQHKRNWAELSGQQFKADQKWLDTQLAKLPYQLTGAQQKALADIRADLSSGHPMNRLLQGDVGSGKTVIAALGAAIVIENNAQAAILAPTSILAEQHFASFTKLLADENGVIAPEQIRLMIGATPESEKKEIKTGLESGEIKIVIGTHALLEDPVVFKKLQLAVIDEQHRFGVKQRSILRAKGENPHLMVMTATPIPRSLALTVYGDLDLTVMDEMPPGREPVNTYLLYPRERERALGLIRKEIKAGRQAFIIYPLVEESEKLNAKAAVEEHKRIQEEIFPHMKVGLMHGRLKAEEKETVMAQFRDKELDILVSTTVVEVGLDIPNATVMLIESANRFGLAQLHQLRGRVGRGADQSFAILIPETEAEIENERLKAMVETGDGFVLAEKDLEQRGPGQFLGTRQAGFAELQMASLTDLHLIEKARKHAQEIIEKDPDLDAPEYQSMRNAVKERWSGEEGDIS